MKKLSFILIGFILLNTCKGEDRFRYRVIDLKEAVSERKESIIMDSSFGQNKTPSKLEENDIILIENKLLISIKQYNEKVVYDDKIDINDYRFFIIPFLNNQNERCVLVYAYCFDSDEDEWWSLNEWYAVKDGGNCYFRLGFSIKGNSVSTILPNGRA